MRNRNASPSGLYVHIPFCRSKCDYCSFYSVREADSAYSTGRYVQRLIAELESFRHDFGAVELDTVYAGGGTPSILSTADMSLLLEAVSSLFTVADGAEVTVEMNPDDLLRDKLEGFMAAGVNRIVLGIQSGLLNHRQTLGRRGRNCTESDLELFFSVRGLTRCMDFIAGIPGQTRGDIDADFAIIRRFRPEHVSLYMLSVEPGTPLEARTETGGEFEDSQLPVWEHAIHSLKELGYRHYEISNVALPGCESRHNMKYWNFTPYLGAGPGAHSYFNGVRFSNPASLDEYMQQGEFRRIFDYRSEEQLLVEFIMTALRRLDGFSPGEYMALTGKPLPRGITIRLREKENEGLITSENGLLRLSEKGIFLADRVIYDIVETFL